MGGCLMATDWTYRLRLRNLQMLLSLAQTGNMTLSAELLHTTQPGLSKWLKELEDDVGLPLFERHARGLRPTPYGRALIEHARCIEAQLDTAREDMTLLREGSVGVVRIGFAGLSAIDTVPMAVLRAVRMQPKAQIRLVEGRFNSLLESLAAGEVDIVVGLAETSIEHGSQIQSERLYAEPIHLVARWDHPLFAQARITWDDVMNYPWVLWAKGTSVRESIDKALAELERPLPPNFVESNSSTLNVTLFFHSDMIGVTSQRPGVRCSLLSLRSTIEFPLRVR